MVFAFGHMGSLKVTLKEWNRALADLRKRVDDISAKKKAEDKLLELYADMERESIAHHKLKKELL